MTTEEGSIDAQRHRYGGLTSAEVIRAFKMYNEGLSWSNQHKLQHLLDLKNAEDGLKLEGLLKIRWGVRKPIKLQRNDDADPVQFKRNPKVRSFEMSVTSQIERDSFRKRQSLYPQRHFGKTDIWMKGNDGWMADNDRSGRECDSWMGGDVTSSKAGEVESEDKDDTMSEDSEIDAKNRATDLSNVRASETLDSTSSTLPSTFKIVSSNTEPALGSNEEAGNSPPFSYDSLPSSFTHRERETTINDLTNSPFPSSSSCSSSSPRFFLSDFEDSVDEEVLDRCSSFSSSSSLSRVSFRSLRDAESTGKSSGRRRRRLKKGASINGHIYREWTRVFRPDHGSETNVRVKHEHTSIDVINILKEKFRIETPAKDFQLYVVKENGETRAMTDDEVPLITRLKLGPCEADSKIFIMDRNSVPEISAEVAELMHVPEPILDEMLSRIDQAWQRDVEAIRGVYEDYKEHIVKSIKDVEEKEHWV